MKTYSTDEDGVVRNITWEDIEITNTDDCITVNANYKPAPKHAKHFVQVSDLVFRNIRATDCHS